MVVLKKLRIFAYMSVHLILWMDTFTSLKQTEIIPHNASPRPPLPTYIINIQLPTRRTTK